MRLTEIEDIRKILAETNGDKLQSSLEGYLQGRESAGREREKESELSKEEMEDNEEASQYFLDYYGGNNPLV